MKDKQFIEQVFEIAFGENAINRDWTLEECIEQLQNHERQALKWEEKKLPTGDYTLVQGDAWFTFNRLAFTSLQTKPRVGRTE